MKIVVLSDIHDNIVNLEKCLNWAKENRADELICCGDITNSDTLEFLANHFAGPIHLVSGNMELYDESEVKKYSNIKNHGRLARIEIDKKIVGICHEPYLFGKILEKGPSHIIFFGHTHKPWQKTEKGSLIINPGNIAGVLHKATFAFWDTENNALELIILDELGKNPSQK